MTAFVDTAVIMYAVGADHPLREPCQRILAAIEAGEIDAEISIEVVQELAHRYLSIGRGDAVPTLVTTTLDLFAPVLPISHFVMRRLPDLVRSYPRLAARDLIHVAVCQHEGITDIISPDRGFDSVVGLRRIDPSAFSPAG